MNQNESILDSFEAYFFLLGPPGFEMLSTELHMSNLNKLYGMYICVAKQDFQDE